MFHKPRMAEYSYRTSSVTECPIFQVRASTAVDEADQTATVTDCLPSTNSYKTLHTCFPPYLLKIDCELLTVEHTQVSATTDVRFLLHH